MKKFTLFVLAMLMIIPCAFGFSACGKKDDDKTPSTNTLYVDENLSLSSAVAQAQSGDIVKLNTDVTLSEPVKINKSVTIDMGGKTISNTEDIWDVTNKDWSLISVQEGGNLTIKNGNIVAKENDCYALDVRDGGKLTVESGKYIGNVHSVYVYEGEAIINGGEFDIKQLSDITGDSRYTLNCYDANYRNETAKISVTGGKFANYNPAGSTSEYPTANFLAEGYKTTSQTVGEDVWYTVTHNN